MVASSHSVPPLHHLLEYKWNCKKRISGCCHLLRQHATEKWCLYCDGSRVLFSSDSCLKMHYSLGV